MLYIIFHLFFTYTNLTEWNMTDKYDELSLDNQSN